VLGEDHLLQLIGRSELYGDAFPIALVVVKTDHAIVVEVVPAVVELRDGGPGVIVTW
jgi:hypothetical protein